MNGALVDDDERLGGLAAVAFLEIDQASVTSASDDDVHALVTAVARTELTLDQTEGRLHQLGD